MAIKTHNLHFSIGQEPILQNVNLDISSGEFIGIIGPNGGGKTTLLRLLMGFLSPTKGSIEMEGNVGYVPQVHRTDRDFPITLYELVLLGALSKTTWYGTIPKKIKERADELIDTLGLTPHKNKVFGALSGGLAQRALFARTLLSDPTYLLLDEATANIDTQSTQVIFQLLEKLKGKKTILLVTHDLKTVIEKVDLVLCIQREMSTFQPKSVCEHFALGLYHTPLYGLPSNHFANKEKDVQCIH